MVNVVFRKYKDNGEIIALFPQIKASTHGSDILSYMHNGQHGAAAPYAGHDTVPATENEYFSLYKELKAQGYDNLSVRTRIVRS